MYLFVLLFLCANRSCAYSAHIQTLFWDHFGHVYIALTREGNKRLDFERVQMFEWTRDFHSLRVVDSSHKRKDQSDILHNV